MSTAVPTTSLSETNAETPTRLVHLRDLHTHPAQMRTVYDPTAMAALIMQVLHAGGIDASHPIVVSPLPDQEGYFIVSGHRRRMALLFSISLTEQHLHDPQESMTQEGVQAYLATLIAEHGTLEAAALSLLATPYGDHLVTVHLFTADERAQILALQRANYGADAPDVLGIARSFHAAVLAGATERQIAQNAGQSLGYVKKYLALLRIPDALARAITDNTFPLSLAEIVAEVPSDGARQGLSRFLLANTAQITLDGVRACVALLKRWDQFRTPPMSVVHQGQRNMIRLLATLWDRVLTVDAPQAWASAALLLYRNVSPHAPWESQAAYTEWVKVLGGETYYQEGTGLLWEALVRDCLTEVTCTTCPLAALPPRLLERDLSDRVGVLGRPCRTLERDQYQRCVNGFAPTDPLEVRVPFEWADHPDVTRQGSQYVVSGDNALAQAWNAQEAAELAAAAESATEEVTEPPSRDTPPVTAATPQRTGTTRVTAATKTPTTATTPAEPSPVMVMRDKIRNYMMRHTQMDWQHPFATPCSTCQHALPHSPTKDPAVPPCAWASRLRTVQFSQLVAEDGSLTVPVCGQYASTGTWQDRIPVADAPPPFPREYLLAQIRAHAKRAHKTTFEFLTGRPMGPDSYTQWFETQLAEAVGHLSDKQLLTLLVWSIAEYDRHAGQGSFWLPTYARGTAFIPVREISWS